MSEPAQVKRRQLREMLAAERGVPAVSAYDALSAKLIERAGFRLVRTSASAMHHAHGFGDIGLLDIGEQANQAAYIVDAVDLPVVADCEVAGTTANVARAVHALERAGVAGIDIEDEEIPARLDAGKSEGQLSDAEYADRIKAAVDARSDPGLIVVARMERRGASYERVLERCHIAVEAGADGLWMGHMELDHMRRIPTDAPRPMFLVVRRGLSIDQCLDMGFKVAISGNGLARAACWGMETAIEAIKRSGREELFYEEHPDARAVGAWFESVGGGPAHEV